MNNCSPILLFESFCVVEDSIWMSARDFNGLFKGNLKDGSMEFIGCFPDENALKKRLHYGKAIYKDEKIYFTPLEAGCIHVFNLRTSSFEKYGKAGMTALGYSMSLLFEDAIFMVSTRGMDILRYDIKNNTYEIVYKSDLCEKYGYELGIYEFGADVYMMLSKKNVLRRFNMTDYQVEDYLVGEDTRQYQIVAGRENILYFVDKDKPEIISWDISLNMERERSTMEFGMRLNSWQQGMRVLGNAALGEGITLLDIEQLKTKKIFVNKKNAPKKTNMFEVQSAFKYDQDLYFVWQGDEAIYSLNSQEKKMQFFLTDDMLQKIRTEMVCNIGDDRGNVFEEDNVFRLPELIQYLER